MRQGDELAQRYRLGQRLGSGSGGTVWQGRDLRLDRDVAIKLLAMDKPGTGDRRRFTREANLPGDMQHPGITAVYDTGEHEGQMFIVTGLLHGQDLGKFLATRPGGLPLQLGIDFGIQIADALAAAHARGVIHRDLKPSSLFVQARGLLKICDFGLAKDASAAETLTAGQFGTPLYMSPEQWDGAGE